MSKESGGAPPRRRADVERNESALVTAAAEVFATSGVDATVREVAAAAGVGMGTLYRHFPTRAALMVAVFRHQIDACAEAGPTLLAAAPTPFAALLDWVHLFVDFLGTKHGLAKVWQGDDAGFTELHQLFLDRLVPVLSELLGAATASGEVVADIRPYELIRAVGDLVAWTVQDPNYDVRRIVTLLVTGLRQIQPERSGPSGFDLVQV
ncbi:TetR family transcriptional regulator [Actinoplanes sp. SE50]|uniref:TetR/AcrR family transcriptional regulator n=1 Tax=unclassified Actinoplanes TaxID=2626549 RepID=UPI00023ED2F7|nr:MULTISPECIES: TetR/AcrR family transcriptional regulator [unclassified Actinoplanes]AEV87291.1 Fatty acid metabolism regulator protein [Actinoplanes sp. SE50/110]ATO85691.1 TetR family transcriptional regulator [Actinoplanes sp. SE50]SLM03104.1 TetR family transcriptional regulator [Actinoplanes sp. SE50/110]